ncbi:MAG: hypothetical protein ACI4CT_03575 [Lachnospiraceae bacterium]
MENFLQVAEVVLFLMAMILFFYQYGKMNQFIELCRDQWQQHTIVYENEE